MPMSSGKEIPFAQMTLVQKLNAVNKVIDENIRQMLDYGWWRYGDIRY